jgi:glycosyltransferase involved in cell wall biosynthesis
MLSGLIRSASPSFGHHVHSLLRPTTSGLDTAVLTSGTGAWDRPADVAELSAARAVPAASRALDVSRQPATAIAAAGGGHRVIWSIHNGKIAAGRPNAQRASSTGFAPAFWRVPDRIVYVSSSCAKFTGQRLRPEPQCRHRQWHRPAALPVVEAREAAPDAPVVIALVGRYDPLKGHHFLLEVVASHPARDRIQLVFAGRGCDSSAALQRLVARAGLARQCRIHGAVRAIERIYAEADIVILPSVREAFPVTLIEAAATGALIVASDVGEAGKLGFDQRLLFGPGDAAGCARRCRPRYLTWRNGRTEPAQ